MNAVIAIDGPAGSGKSTVARRLAEILGLPHIDTGAMYRAVTLKAIRRGVPVDEAETLGRLAAGSDISVVGGRVLLDGEDVTKEVRSPAVDSAVSAVSAHHSVRKEMVARQRKLVHDGAVMEGRDIGTVVLPDADLKVFLTASPAARATRRADELEGRGVNIDRDEVMKEIEERDRLDSERQHSPLGRAEDAFEIDSTGHSVDEVVQMIVDELSRRSRT